MTKVLSITSELSEIEADTLKLAISALEQLEAADGRLAKKTVIADNKDNPAFQFFLKAAMCGDVYNIVITDWVRSSDTRLPHLKAFHTFVKLLLALRDREITGNSAISRTRGFLSKCHPKLRVWMWRTLNRDLRCGIGKKTVETVFGKGFWVDASSLKRGWYFQGCLAAKLHSKVYKKKTLEFPVAAEVKLDGERGCQFYIGKDDYNYIFSRKGKRKPHIESVSQYNNQIADFSTKLCDVAGIETALFLDGEFLSSNWNVTSSVVSRSVNFSPEDFLNKVRIVLFDWAPLKDYMSGEFSLPWRERKRLLLRAAGVGGGSTKPTCVSKNVYVLGHHILHNQSQLETLYTWALDAGFEGLMLKSLDGPHVFHRRHTHVVKMKADDHITGEIVGVIPGEKKNARAPEHMISAVRNYLESYGKFEDDGYYFHLPVKNEKERRKVFDKLKEIVHDGVEQRVSSHLDGFVSYRYSERAGKLEVVLGNGDKVYIGTGIPHRSGNDLRMKFWQERDELVGMKVDFCLQLATGTESILARNPRFVRLRRDLS